MLRLGVVGCGQMGQHHTRVLSGLGHKLVGVADIDPKRANDLAAQFNVKAYSPYDRLIDDVDAVTIAVPTSQHTEVAMAFLRKGVHCLVEKPIARSLDEAQMIMSEAKNRAAKLMVGHVERFNPAVAALKEVLTSGALGKLAMISTRRAGPFPPRIKDVGVILDLATHDIDVVRYLLGREPLTVFAREGRCNHVSQDYAAIFLDFGNPVACIEVNWLTPHKVRTLTVTGSEGIAYVDYIKQEVVVHNSAGQTVPPVNTEEPLKRELQHFISCIENNTEPLVTGLDATKVLEIALQATAHARLEEKAQQFDWASSERRDLCRGNSLP